ncbi:hypothetical protein SBOR_9193 [Sclerotinia borealis F-4128]|uniref:Pathway-specific nitrogen regulator n=1 Tax=Sclerotinia borealis (strain F-4128) TaxID=1432307 RepID=W9C406_SCLBF|nr:hypothetical protein SBOR_9193 [Sclerotinia borealis F-4128]
MSKSNSRRQSDFEIHEDSNGVNDMVEDKDIKKVDGGENANENANAKSEDIDVGEGLSRSSDVQRDMGDGSEVDELEVGGDSILEDQELSDLQEGGPILDHQELSELQEGDSILDQELSELHEDDSILDDTKPNHNKHNSIPDNTEIKHKQHDSLPQNTKTKHNEHDDCEDCKHAREEKRKRAEARELHMQRIEAEIKDAARKVVESIERDNPKRSMASTEDDDLMSTQMDESYEPEDYDDSLLSAGTDESYEPNLYNGQDGTELTFDTTKSTLEDDGQTEEDEDSILHHNLSSTDAETERGNASGEDIEGGDSSHYGDVEDGDVDDGDVEDGDSSHYGDVKDDVFSNNSVKHPRFSMDSADEAPNRMSNRSSWQSNRQLDLSKEAQQLIELNSPVVGEEAATESVISRIPSGRFQTSAPRARDSSCSPRKVSRHPFRTPSDIRAMQMYSPAPSLFSTPQSSKRRQNPTVSRLGTPSGSQFSKSRTPNRFKKNREEPPLVLLHVTVLPLQWQYSKAIVAPELPANLYNIREAYYLLQEKLSDTILTRGILLPHPQESYECLEERFLDALELPVRPRAKILRCGHYMGPNTTSSDDDSADEKDSGFGSTGRFKTKPDKVWCDICRRDVKYEDDDLDEDDKKFNIKIFASNGLMRAGAWAAAWREMERVDVEIEPFVQPWMVEDMEDLIERLREAEEGEGDDSFGHYSDDDTHRESLGSEAQRLYDQDMAKVTLRQKTTDVESRNAREKWLVTASRAAEEEVDRVARESELIRLKEELAAKSEGEEVKRLEEEAEAFSIQKESEAAQAEEEVERLRDEAKALRIQVEEVERLRVEAEAEVTRVAEELNDGQKLSDLEAESWRFDKEEDLTAKEFEAEAQQIHEEEMAANQALEEEAQRIHKAEVAEQLAIEEEAQRIYDSELAEEKAIEEDAKKIMEEKESSRKAKENEDSKRKLEKEERSTEEARLKEIYNQASTRTKKSIPSGDESLTELLVKAAGVAMRDRKNVLIILLSVVVLFLALKPSTDIMPKYVPDIIIQNHRYEVSSPSVDQRGYEAMRQAVAEGTLPMREIDNSMGWKGPKGQEVVVTSSIKAQELVVVQSEIAEMETKIKGKRVIMEIEASDDGPMVEITDKAEILQVEAEAVPILKSEEDVHEMVAKDIPVLDSPGSLEGEDLATSETQDIALESESEMDIVL